MEKQPEISIIVPVYNTAPYIEECLESVINQDYPDWEVIAVDDGSTDSSGSILDRYARKDGRIRPLHISNHGVSHARNYGIRHARGRWIYCLDSDDFLLEGALYIVGNAIAKYPQADTIRFHFKCVGPDLTISDTRFYPPPILCG